MDHKDKYIKTSDNINKIASYIQHTEDDIIIKIHDYKNFINTLSKLNNSAIYSYYTILKNLDK